MPFLIFNNALNKNVQTNGLPVKKTLNVSQLFKIVKLNADQRFHAGLYAFPEKEVKLLLMSPNALKLTIVCQPLSKKQLLPLLLLNNALNKSVQTNGLTAKKTPNVAQLFKSAKPSVDQRSHAGIFVSLQKEVKQLLMSPNVLNIITVLQSSFLQLTLLLNENNSMPPILLHVPKRNALDNGLPAKKIQNACLPSKTVKRSAELSHRAGLFAYQLREVKPPLILPNALKPKDASEWCQPLNLA